MSLIVFYGIFTSTVISFLGENGNSCLRFLWFQFLLFRVMECVSTPCMRLRQMVLYFSGMSLGWFSTSLGCVSGNCKWFSLGNENHWFAPMIQKYLVHYYSRKYKVGKGRPLQECLYRECMIWMTGISQGENPHVSSGGKHCQYNFGRRNISIWTLF